jgi:hypothetical protein
MASIPALAKTRTGLTSHGQDPGAVDLKERLSVLGTAALSASRQPTIFVRLGAAGWRE